VVYTVMRYQPPGVKMTILQFRLLKKRMSLWSFWKNKNA
jgi:hypothetical protein